MFWGLFSYDYKGPRHVYYTETAKEKAIYKGIMDEYNTVLLPHKEAE